MKLDTQGQNHFHQAEGQFAFTAVVLSALVISPSPFQMGAKDLGLRSSSYQGMECPQVSTQGLQMALRKLGFAPSRHALAHHPFPSV